MILRIVIHLLFVMLTGTLSAQQLVWGKIYDKKKDKVLAYVTIRNITQQVSRQSDIGGNYRIIAAVGDLLVFSSAAYLPDTIRVSEFMLANTYDISLQQNTEVLETVTVGEYNNYQLDSLSRRDEYRKFYAAKKAKLTGDNTPVGFGITFSPVSFFSRKEKQKRKLMKRLPDNEKQYYIDYRFSSSYVAKLTGLQQDSLHIFMLRYRPSYEFCRNSSQEDMLLYINDRLRQFKKK